MWDMGVRGKLWRVIRRMYAVTRSALLLEGEKSASFSVVVQGCSLSILFSIFINDLLKEVDKANLRIQFSSGKKVGGLPFADDFVGVCNSAESLQSLIDTIHGHCSRWRLRANVSKSSVMISLQHP